MREDNLIAIIVEEEQKVYSELHQEIYNNEIRLKGFRIENKKITRFHLSSLEKLWKALTMSEKNIYLGNREGIDIYFDKKTNLYHFFRNGKEDIKKLLDYNSEEAINSKIEKDFLSKKIQKLRKIKINGIVVYFSILLLELNALSSLINQIGIPNISAMYENIKNYGEEIKPQDIKEILFASEKLSNTTKSFIWNEELINMVTPYYNLSYYNILSSIRHTDIEIESFKEEDYPDSAGFYKFGNKLYIRDYDVENIKRQERTSTKATLSHEYIHLLQCLSCFNFICEASAEMISEEFYMSRPDENNKTLNLHNENYGYKQACNYLSILMEIIGPEPIIDNNFNPNSTAIQESIKPFLSEEQYNSFLKILDLSPYSDREKLENGGYQELEELLKVLYQNKYQSNMMEDDMIQAILSNKEFSRPYFRKSLIDTYHSSYYITYEKKHLNFEINSSDDMKKALEKNIINIINQKAITQNEYYELLKQKSPVNVEMEYHNIKSLNNYKVEENGEEVSIEKAQLESGEEIPIEEAIVKGYITMKYYLLENISYYDYMKNPTNPNYKIIPAAGWECVDKENQKYETFEKIYTREYHYVPSISEKINHLESNRSR